MNIAAPPGPPDSTETGHDDIFEALIEEAKQRARQRRRLYGVAASVAAIAIVGAIVGFNSAGSSTSHEPGLDSAAGSPSRDLGVFEPIRGWIVFPDGAGIGAVDPDDPSSRRTVLADPEGISAAVQPVGWSPEGTELALADQGVDQGDYGGSWIMDSTGSLINVVPFSGCCTPVVGNPLLPADLQGGVLWRLSDGSAHLIPHNVATWMTIDDRRVGAEPDTTRKWKASLIVGHTALSPDRDRLLLTAPSAHSAQPWESVHWWDLPPNSAATQGLYVLEVYGGTIADGTVSDGSPLGRRVPVTPWLHRMGGHLDGSTLRRITAGSYLAAAWSPDGTQIAAISATPEGRELVVMNADGTDQQALIELDSDLQTGIAWHPGAPND